MKIAFTADVHLTSRKTHPERFNALDTILTQMKKEGCSILIVAGDLFDKDLKNYAEFDALCNKKKNQALEIHVIPGNHDPDLSSSAFASENVKIYSEPQLFRPDPSGSPFLLLPFKDGKTMGEVIEEFASELTKQQWILVGHGNYLGGLRVPNPYEIGVYMPLTTSDLERYQPRDIFLGHIHNAPEHLRVHYMGSPCGLNITETGKRHFLMYDTKENTVQRHKINVDVLFFDETLVMLPVENEKAFLEQISSELIDSWELSEEEHAKVILRLNIKGYCADKAALGKRVKSIFSRFKFWKDDPPDSSEVSVSEDLERRYIVDKVKDGLDKLKWPEGPDEPDTDDILLTALSLIYGG